MSVTNDQIDPDTDTPAEQWQAELSMRLGFDPEFDGENSYVAGVVVPQRASSVHSVYLLSCELSGLACWWSQSDRNVAWVVDWCHRTGREDEVRAFIASPWSYTSWYCEMKHQEYEDACYEKQEKQTDELFARCGIARPGKAQ
jgi:hypothetical protein